MLKEFALILNKVKLYLFLFSVASHQAFCSLELENNDTICRKHFIVKVEENYSEEDSAQQNYIKASHFINKLKEEIKTSSYPMHNIVLTLCGINNESLTYIRKNFFDKNKEVTTVIDLSYNHFDVRSSPDLLEILKYNHLRYLNLVGTPLSLKKISILLKSLAEIEEPETVKELSKKLVFMEKSYINKAKKTVQTYHSLVEEGLLHENWDHSHWEFYRIYDKKINRDINNISVNKLSDSLRKFKI